MLQSLLQPRENQRSKMIGAMPAVAVRHERRRNEKRSAAGAGGAGCAGGAGAGGRRPSQLPLQLGRPLDPDATPSPRADHHFRNELYVCGKVALLHAIVGALLLGIVVLVVGLVQLSPGAEAAQHRYYLMGAGAALTGGGIIAAVLRCICLHWFNRKYGGGGGSAEAAPAHKSHAHAHHAGAVCLVDAAHTHGHAAHTQGHSHATDKRDKREPKHDLKHDPKNEVKPKLKAQASVTAPPPAPAPAPAPVAAI